MSTLGENHDRAQESPGIRKMKLAGATAYMLPEELIQLNIELGTHAAAHKEVLDYVERVVTASGPNTDWITKLSAVAAYLGILMDGTYGAEALNIVAEECRKQLVARRTLSVTGTSGSAV